ncbi:MAG: hypothetical protein KBF73_09250, partial [Flavobacteriales bacterium]|nr:hypothetical protein [Flavobacteriales bacterium]
IFFGAERQAALLPVIFFGVKRHDVSYPVIFFAVKRPDVSQQMNFSLEKPQTYPSKGSITRPLRSTFIGKGGGAMAVLRLADDDCGLAEKPYRHPSNNNYLLRSLRSFFQALVKIQQQPL